MARVLTIGVVITLVAVLAWFGIGTGAGPPVGGCSVSPGSPIAGGLDPPDALATVTWRPAALPASAEGADEQIMLDVVAFGEGFVAVGRSSNGPDSHAFVLLSADGLEWQTDDGDAQRFAGTELSQLAVAGRRLFAIGSATTDDRGGSRAAVWYTDDGREWTEATGPFTASHAYSLAAGDDGILMLGVANANTLPRAWRSDDGETWEEHALELPVGLSQASFGSLAALGDGWHAAGSVANGVDAARAPVIWRSGDGASWSCHVLDAGGFSRASAWGLHQAAGSWLAFGDGGEPCGFGSSCVGHPIAWISDGLSWSAARVDQEARPPAGSAVAGTPDGFVAVTDGGTWTSADGARWARLEGGVVAPAGDALAATDDGRLVVVGTRYDGSDGDAWIAFGELSR